MSVWSKKHTDLAKLAKSIQDNNNQTRRRLIARSTSVAEGSRSNRSQPYLQRAKSLSPGRHPASTPAGVLLGRDSDKPDQESSGAGKHSSASLPLGDFGLYAPISGEEDLTSDLSFRSEPVNANHKTKHQVDFERLRSNAEDTERPTDTFMLKDDLSERSADITKNDATLSSSEMSPNADASKLSFDASLGSNDFRDSVILDFRNSLSTTSVSWRLNNSCNISEGSPSALNDGSVLPRLLTDQQSKDSVKLDQQQPTVPTNFSGKPQLSSGFQAKLARLNNIYTTDSLDDSSSFYNSSFLEENTPGGRDAGTKPESSSMAGTASLHDKMAINGYFKKCSDTAPRPRASTSPDRSHLTQRTESTDERSHKRGRSPDRSCLTQRTESTEEVSHRRGRSPVPMAPCSPRLLANSPGLLRKLREVSSSISSCKSDKVFNDKMDSSFDAFAPDCVFSSLTRSERSAVIVDCTSAATHTGVKKSCVSASPDGSNRLTQFQNQSCVSSSYTEGETEKNLLENVIVNLHGELLKNVESDSRLDVFSSVLPPLALPTVFGQSGTADEVDSGPTNQMLSPANNMTCHVQPVAESNRLKEELLPAHHVHHSNAVVPLKAKLECQQAHSLLPSASSSAHLDKLPASHFGASSVISGELETLLPRINTSTLSLTSPSDGSCTLREFSQNILPSPTSDSKNRVLNIRDFDLKLVPLSAIGIVVGTSASALPDESKHTIPDELSTAASVVTSPTVLTNETGHRNDAPSDSGGQLPLVTRQSTELLNKTDVSVVNATLVSSLTHDRVSYKSPNAVEVIEPQQMLISCESRDFITVTDHEKHVDDLTGEVYHENVCSLAQMSAFLSSTDLQQWQKLPVTNSLSTCLHCQTDGLLLALSTNCSHHCANVADNESVTCTLNDFSHSSSESKSVTSSSSGIEADCLDSPELPGNSDLLAVKQSLPSPEHNDLKEGPAKYLHRKSYHGDEAKNEQSSSYLPDTACLYSGKLENAHKVDQDLGLTYACRGESLTETLHTKAPYESHSVGLSHIETKSLGCLYHPRSRSSNDESCLSDIHTCSYQDLQPRTKFDHKTATNSSCCECGGLEASEGSVSKAVSHEGGKQVVGYEAELSLQDPTTAHFHTRSPLQSRSELCVKQLKTFQSPVRCHSHHVINRSGDSPSYVHNLLSRSLDDCSSCCRGSSPGPSDRKSLSKSIRKESRARELRSEPESEISLVSASRQPSLNKRNSSKSKAVRSERHARTRAERPKQEKSGVKSSDSMCQQETSSSISSMDSLLSMTDTDCSSSSCSSEVVNYKTTALHTREVSRRSVNKRRLKKLLRALQRSGQPHDASLDNSAKSEFTRTVADLQHLIFALSTKVEQQQEQYMLEQERQRLEVQRRVLREREEQEQRQLQEQEERIRQHLQHKQDQRRRVEEEQELYRQHQLQKLQLQLEQLQRLHDRLRQLEQAQEEKHQELLLQQLKQKETLEQHTLQLSVKGQLQEKELQQQQEVLQLQLHRQQLELLRQKHKLARQLKSLPKQAIREDVVKSCSEKPQLKEVESNITQCHQEKLPIPEERRDLEVTKLRSIHFNQQDLQQASKGLTSLSKQQSKAVYHSLLLTASELNESLMEEVLKNMELLSGVGIDRCMLPGHLEDLTAASTPTAEQPADNKTLTSTSSLPSWSGPGDATASATTASATPSDKERFLAYHFQPIRVPVSEAVLNADDSEEKQEKENAENEREQGKEKERRGSAAGSVQTLQEEVEEGRSTPEQGKAEEKQKAGADVATMESAEEVVKKLDDEFDRTLMDMKPHVLKLPLKTDRQKCAVWIKKLCDPPSSGITGRKTRNLYSLLMLKMLKRGLLQSPFDRKPDDGPLTPLPSYMSIHFDESLDKPDEPEKLPDWVEGELGDSGTSSLFRRTTTSGYHGNPAATSTWVSGAGSSLHTTRQRPHTSMGVPLDKDPGLSPIRGERQRFTGYSADDLSVELHRSPLRLHSPPARSRSPDRTDFRHLPDVKRNQSPDVKAKEPSDFDWTRPIGGTFLSSATSVGKGFFDETSLPKPGDREIALRTKMMEAKFHEEKLRLQQKHDADVQKILDRKNSEIEDVKNHYRNKSKDLEETITKLERKVQTLVKESALVRETKDKQIAELKKMVDQTNESQRNEYEKQIHEMEADFEQQKIELQKLHSHNIREIVTDTDERLKRMEAEYSQQASTTTSIIKELESRVQQLTEEVDRTLAQRSSLEKEKVELQARVEKLVTDLEEQRHRGRQMERELQKKLETSEHEMRTLRNKTEASLEYLKQEQSISSSKAADTISDLEQQVDYLKKAVKDAEEQRQRQMRETEQVHQQDRLHLENLHDKQVRSMKKELEQLEQEMQRKLSRLDQMLQDKDAEVQKLKEAHREQLGQAEKALEEFKLTVEKNQNQIYSEMKQQMEQVETDLKKSKQAREKQSREFARQVDEEKYKHEHELADLRLSLENDKSQLLHEVHAQKELLMSEHEREMEQTREQYRSEVRSLEIRHKERLEKESKVTAELEVQVSELREELVQANQLRKQQLVELGLLREEEKQKMQRDHEMEIARLRTEAEQQRLELQKLHSVETERLLDKTNEKLKSIEREYLEKGKKSSEAIGELQNCIKQLRDDIKRSKEAAESRVLEIRSQAEEEKQNLKKQYASNLSIVQHELESQRTRCHNLERQLQKMEADHEEKVTRVMLEQEERLRGMLPRDLKQELEDTIASLRSQVATLQQRAALLQEELDLRLKNPLGQFGSCASSPIKSSV